MYSADYSASSQNGGIVSYLVRSTTMSQRFSTSSPLSTSVQSGKPVLAFKTKIFLLWTSDTSLVSISF